MVFCYGSPSKLMDARFVYQKIETHQHNSINIYLLAASNTFWNEAKNQEINY